MNEQAILGSEQMIATTKRKNYTANDKGNLDTLEEKMREQKGELMNE